MFTKKQKIHLAIFLVMIIIGIIITSKLGLRFDLEYLQNTKVKMYIEKDFDIEDIKLILIAVLGKDKPNYIQTINKQEKQIAITVENITDEQIKSLLEKINEKYDLEITKEEITIENNSNLRGRDIIKPYVLPICIVIAIVEIYLVLRYLKIGIGKVLLFSIGGLMLEEALYLSILAIFRFSICKLTMPIALGIMIITILGINYRFEKMMKVNK